jgi:hypothetical protein
VIARQGVRLWSVGLATECCDEDRGFKSGLSLEGCGPVTRDCSGSDVEPTRYLCAEVARSS